MSGTPASLSGSAANARKSGSEWTCTRPNLLTVVQSRRHPHRTHEEFEVLPEVDREAGALMTLDVESVERDPGDDVVGAAGRAGGGQGRRRGDRVATSDSASRRTRGSSS